MGSSPLLCLRYRDGHPAPLPVKDLRDELIAGALKADLSSDELFVEWTNGLVECSFVTEGCPEQQAFGIYISRFTCMTAIDRVFRLMTRLGMAVIWDGVILPDDEVARHYRPDVLRIDETWDVARSTAELAEIMSIVWVNCPAGALDVV